MTSPRRNLVLAGDDRGAVMVFATLIIVVLLLAAGLVVDLGQQRAAARDAQADADVIALDMARLSDGSTSISVLAGSNHSVVLGELNASARRNQVQGVASKDDGTTAGNAGRIVLLDGDDLRLEIQWGWLSEDSDATQCGQQTQIRDEAAAPWFAECTSGSQTPNAARVTAYDSVDFRLLPVGNGPSRGGVVRTAFARHGAEDLAGFQLGAYGATALEDGILSNMLEPLLGPNPLGAGVLTPDALAAANVNVFEVAAELGLLTTDAALNTALPISDYMIAAATVLARNGDAAAATALNAAATAVVENVTITLGQVVGVSNGAENSGADLMLSPLDLLRTGASIASCGEDLDSYQVQDCSGVSVPSIQTSLPLATSTGSLKVIESRRRKYGFIGDGIRNSQIQLDQHATLGTINLGIVRVSALKLDYNVRVADGYTSIADIVCRENDRELHLASTTGLYTLQASIVLDVQAVVLGIPVKVAQLGWDLTIGVNGQNEIVPFVVPPDELGVTEKHAGANTVGLGTIQQWNARTPIVLGALPLQIGDLINLVTQNVVNPLLTAVDTSVLAPLTNILGVNAVGSELVALDIDCAAGGVQLVG